MPCPRCEPRFAKTDRCRQAERNNKTKTNHDHNSSLSQHTPPFHSESGCRHPASPTLLHQRVLLTDHPPCRTTPAWPQKLPSVFSCVRQTNHRTLPTSPAYQTAIPAYRTPTQPTSIGVACTYSDTVPYPRCIFSFFCGVTHGTSDAGMHTWKVERKARERIQREKMKKTTPTPRPLTAMMAEL